MLLALFMVTVTALPAGCGQSRTEIGMVETNLPGRWRATYQTLTGAKVDTLTADAGEALVLSYDVQVTKGELSIEVRQPGDEPVWDVSLKDDAQAVVELDIQQDGRHRIVVEGDNAGGGFDISWELE